MLNTIENTIKKYFPEQWSRKDIEFWIGKPRFDVDVNAIQKNLNEPLRDFLLRGGKRWRPVLFLTTLKLLGARWKSYLDVACALELAHNATLIIDDLEDGAELRRGKPVCHRIFGVDMAVNAGCAAYFLPPIILQKRAYKNDRQKAKILQIYNEEMLNVHFGQALDIRWHNKPKEIATDEYLEMCRLKTGGLVRMAVRMACTLSDKSEKFEDDLKKFAESAGIAFQIKDDALEFTSNEKIFGKSFGNDITEGKMSLPVIFAIKKLGVKDKNRLLRILGLHTHDKELLKEAFAIIVESGAVEEALRYADRLIDTAWKGIEPTLPKNKKKELAEFKELTYFLVKRDR